MRSFAFDLHPAASKAAGAGRFEPLDQADMQATLARLESLARILDSVVRIPGTDVRVGVDALLGVVPVLGDLASQLISGYLILEARRLGCSRWTIARMAANSTIDTVVGAIPIVGDVFDVMYRSNLKNIALLRRHIETNGVRPAAARDGVIIEGRAERVG